MRRVTYDVAISMDGFISDAAGGVEGFVPEGAHVEHYLERLQDYDTALMGRRTYEFGYRFGMEPGAAPYPHMRNYVFSSQLELPTTSEVVVVKEQPSTFVQNLKDGPGGEIYLCGGGALAHTLLEARLIDRIILKLNPFISGGGVPLVSGGLAQQFRLADVRDYGTGVVLLTYDRP